jgi:flavin-dependent dehydrogenase
MFADLVIVGAGPAGLATAIHGAQHGMSSIVLDRRPPSQPEGFGEALMPSSVDVLDRLGVELPLVGTRPLAGVRFIESDTRAEGMFHRGHGLGLQWPMLMQSLHSRAVMLGVTMRYGETVTAWRDVGDSVVVDTSAGRVGGRFLVGADGAHGSIGPQAGLTASRVDELPMAMCRQYATKPWSSYVEVHLTDEGEVVVAPVGASAVNVTVRSRRNGNCGRVVASSPGLVRHLAGATVCSPALHTGAFAPRAWRRHRGNVALVGDAAGCFDLLAGESVTLAMRTGMALTEVLAQGRSLSHYEPAYRRITRNRVIFDRLLMRVASRPEARHRMVVGLRAAPEAFGRLLDVVGGTRKLSGVGALTFARLVAGVMRTPARRLPQASVVQLENHPYGVVDVTRIEVADGAPVRREPSLDAG